MQTLDSERRNKLTGLECLQCGGTIWWWGEFGGVLLLKSADDIELSKGEGNGWEASISGG